MPFEKRNAKAVSRINRLQQERFDLLVEAFDPPLPEGVPERLTKIVRAAGIGKGASVLDDFPGESKVRRLFNPFGSDIRSILDEPDLDLLILAKRS